MTGDTPSPLVPKLRFPEFGNMPGWELTQLSDVLDYEQPGKYIVEDSNYQNAGTPVLTANKGFVLGHTAETEGIYQHVPVIIFDDFTTDAKYVNFPFKVKSSAIKILTSRGEDELRLVYELMSRIRFDSTQHKRYFISQYQYLKIPLPGKSEQKKIADCLGSLDDLIAGEGRKLEALRQHKQGLMLQLFPQAGETQPRLRFPEFQDTQEWRVAPLGELFETKTGGTPNRARPDYWGGEVPWVTTSIVDFNVIESTRESISSAGLSNSSAKVFPKRTVLMALYGQGKTRGKVAMLGIEAATNQACAAILPSDEVDPRFVFLNLSGRYEEIRANSNSGGQKNLSQALVRDLPFAYPKERAEQHRIAECLSMLDARLAAQVQKLDALKTHKQGLLQQLFPPLKSQ